MSISSTMRQNWAAGCAWLFRSRFLVVAASATGVSVATQLLAFLRQAMIAAFFGIGRDLELYVMTYAVATSIAFTFGAIFDSVVVSRLVRARENEGMGAARELAAAILRISLCIAGAASVLLLVLMPLLAPIIATGFGPQEWPDLSRLGWYFIPWICAYLPYYAVAAWHKSQWQFRQMFSAEIVVIVTSIIVLAIWHRDIRSLPLAYATGYVAGTMLLLVGSGLLHRSSRNRSLPLRDLLRNMGEFYFAIQSGNLVTLVDRHIQSFVPAGGVAALNYSSQLINNVSSLLLLREAFIVPLAQQNDSASKLERLISGLTLVAIPLAGIIICFAPEILTVLFERGRFDASATTLTAKALCINAMGLLTVPVLGPLSRMLQITDRIHYTHLMYLAMAAASAFFGYLFVLVLDLGVRGVALMQLTSSITACIVIAWAIARCGIALRWSTIFRHLILAAGAAGTAFFVAMTATWLLQNAWGRLLAGSSVYAIVVLGFYLPARSHIRAIIFGAPENEAAGRK
jgi:putative peptidoglycan lipid II flippase